MKKNLFMSALMTVAAFAAGSVLAEAYSEGFEDYAVSNLITVLNNNWQSGGNDQSMVVAGNGGKVLQLATEGDTLTNSLPNAVALNAALGEDGAVVFESMIKFVPSDMRDFTPEGADTKFAIYAYHDDNLGEAAASNTFLVVYHAYETEEYAREYVAEVFDGTGGNTKVEIDPNAFVSLKVMLTPGSCGPDNVLHFSVTVNDQDIESAYPAEYEGESTLMATVNQSVTDNDNNSLSSLCFKGTGAVDAIEVDVEAAEEAFTTDDTVDGAEITQAQADWLNKLVTDGIYEYADLVSALESRLSTVNGEDASLEDCRLLGIDPVNGSATFEVAGIEVGNGTVDITVSIDRTDAVDATSINGVLKIKGLATLGGTEYSYDQEVSAADFTDGDFSATYTITPAHDEVFFKAAIETTASSVGE